MQLVSKISNLCLPDPPTLYSQTDGHHAIAILRYASASRGNNTKSTYDVTIKSTDSQSWRSLHTDSNKLRSSRMAFVFFSAVILRLMNLISCPFAFVILIFSSIALDVVRDLVCFMFFYSASA